MLCIVDCEFTAQIVQAPLGRFGEPKDFVDVAAETEGHVDAAKAEGRR